MTTCAADSSSLMAKREQERLWLELLRCQVGLTLPLEIPHYYASDDWMAAPAVLDLGAGPGYHLNEVARVFPKKTYIGVDIDGRYVAIGQREGGPSTRFVHSDLFATSGSYPFVISRLVAQHLPSLPAFLDKVHDLLVPGGCFMSVEPNDLLRRFHPTLPAVQAVFAAYTQSRRQAGLDRHAGLTLCTIAAAHGLQVQSSVDVVIPSSIPGYKPLFSRFHELVMQLFDEVFGIPMPTEQVFRELRDWSADDYGYAQLGVRLTIVRRI